MTTQLRLLIALRWRMVRSRRTRLGFLLLAALLPVLCLAAGVAGALTPHDRSFDVLLLAPTAYLSVALLAVLAPLVLGGGNELYPPEQLVAFPISSRTHYLASLALAPLNLAWATQLVGLIGLTTFVSTSSGAGPRVLLAVVVCLAYVALVTVAGQSLAWFVVGVRQRSWGRRTTWAVAAVAVLAGGAVLQSGHTSDVLDASPTTWVVLGAVNGATGDLGRWSVVVASLVVGSWGAFRLGRVACAWSLRQPGPVAGNVEGRPVRRRPARGSVLREHLAIDRASVWRSPSLRRGLLVLGLLPGAVAAAAGLQWSSLVLLPGLVAAGAGLLFGVNAFCLDGSGSVWLASLPADARVVFRAKAQVIAEVCGVAVLLTVVAGGVRAATTPTAAEAVALVACAMVTIARVVATCMHLSVRRPHRAELRGPRDTPAPPGVMATYSARLALSTTLIAVLFSVTAELGDWRVPALLALPFLLLSARRLVATATFWEQPSTRARVVTAVASG